jgi:hypothetical protein
MHAIGASYVLCLHTSTFFLICSIDTRKYCKHGRVQSQDFGEFTYFSTPECEQLFLGVQLVILSILICMSVCLANALTVGLFSFSYLIFKNLSILGRFLVNISIH